MLTKLNNLKKDKINLTNIPEKKFSFTKKITTDSNTFIEKCFNTAIKILKKKNV